MAMHLGKNKRVWKEDLPSAQCKEVPVQGDVGKRIYWRGTVLRHVDLGKEVLPIRVPTHVAWKVFVCP